MFVAVPNDKDALDGAKVLIDKQMRDNAVLNPWWQDKGAGTAPALGDVFRRVRALSEHLGDEIVLAMSPTPDGRNALPVVMAEVKRPGLRALLERELAAVGAGDEIQLLDRAGLSAGAPRRRSRRRSCWSTTPWWPWPRRLATCSGCFGRRAGRDGARRAGGHAVRPATGRPLPGWRRPAVRRRPGGHCRQRLRRRRQGAGGDAAAGRRRRPLPGGRAGAPGRQHPEPGHRQLRRAAHGRGILAGRPGADGRAGLRHPGGQLRGGLRGQGAGPGAG